MPSDRQRGQRIGLGVERVDRARSAVAQCRRRASAVAQRRPGPPPARRAGAGEARAELEQRRRRPACARGCGRGRDEVRQQRGPHRRQLGVERVALEDRLARAERRGMLGRDERPGDGLGIAELGHGSAAAAARRRCAGVSTPELTAAPRVTGTGGIRSKPCRRASSSTMQASVRDVVAPGRRLRPAIPRGRPAAPKPSAAEQALDLRRLELDAGEPRQTRGAGSGPPGPAPAPRRRRPRRTGRAAAQLEDQPGGELGRRQHQLRVEAALEAGAGVALDAEPAAGGRRAQRIEQRHLEQHVGRARVDAGALAAHDAAEADRAARVGDHGHAVVQPVGPAVQRLQLLAEPGEAQHEVALELGRRRTRAAAGTRSKVR